MSIPKFEKKNHHYVPQFWQRGFLSAGGQLYGRRDSTVVPVSTRTTMASDWLYTVFDNHWNPSDAIEDILSTLESRHASLFTRLQLHGYRSTASDRGELVEFLAIQTVRHPDILGRGHRLSRALGDLLVSIHHMTLLDFQKAMAGFGVAAPDAHNCYLLLRTRTPDQLAKERDDLYAQSPQSPQLPTQDALLAKPNVMQAISSMELCLLDAPTPEAFVLGDTPLPQSDLYRGFTVPISHSLAVVASPTVAIQRVLSRRTATAQEVQETNRWQFDNALEIVVGPSATTLGSL